MLQRLYSRSLLLARACECSIWQYIPKKPSPVSIVAWFQLQTFPVDEFVEVFHKGLVAFNQREPFPHNPELVNAIALLKVV